MKCVDCKIDGTSYDQIRAIPVRGQEKNAFPHTGIVHCSRQDFIGGGQIFFPPCRNFRVRLNLVLSSIA